MEPQPNCHGWPWHSVNTKP